MQLNFFQATGFGEIIWTMMFVYLSFAIASAQFSSRHTLAIGLATPDFSLPGVDGKTFNRDRFQYVYKPIKGDFTATANLEFMGDKGNGHRKVGWMLRASTDDKSIHLSAVIHGDELTVLQWRSKKGANMLDPQEEIFFPGKKFEVVQLQGIGKKVIMRVNNLKP